MNILAIGDVVGSVGCRFLRSRLPALKKTYGIDLVIANGEKPELLYDIVAGKPIGTRFLVKR